jgi:hypothetical protein
LKDLSKEVRHAERFLNSLNPPKPERESKRKKKKPINKDFVDFSQPQGMEEPVSIELNKYQPHEFCSGGFILFLLVLGGKSMEYSDLLFVLFLNTDSRVMKAHCTGFNP